MSSLLGSFGVLFGLCLMCVPAWADVGLLPTPTLVGVQTQAVVTYDSSSQIYSYNYMVTNPSSNTGQVWLIKVDLTTKFPKAFVPPFDSTDLTLPYGA